MLKYVILIVFMIISEVLTYKYIKMIDKKQRKKLYNWELKYIQEIEELKKQIVEEKDRNKKKGGNKNAEILVGDSINNSKNVLESTPGREDNMQTTQ